MSKRFDPYFEWLNISPGQHPPDFYELLGLKKFEANEALIRKAAKNRKRLLNGFIPGARGTTAKSLIKEIVQAYQILSQHESKAAYDNRLRHLLSAGQTQRSFDTFVEGGPALDPIQRLLADGRENSHEEEFLMRQKRSHEKKPHRDFPIVTVLICMGLFTLVAALGLFAFITRPTVVSVEPEEVQVQPTPDEVKIANSESLPFLLKDAPAADDDEGARSVAATDVPPKEPAVDKLPDPIVGDTEATEPTPPDSNAIAPKEMAKWKSMLGLTATLEGVVLKEGVSSTGKTLYLWFATDRDNNAMVFMLTRDIGDDLSLEYLRSLSGKRIRVTGIVEEQNWTKRIGVKIRSQRQIEIVE